MITFLDYNFNLTPAGDIFMDPELKPEQLEVQTGDKFEVVVVPGVGVVFKKLPRN